MSFFQLLKGHGTYSSQTLQFDEDETAIDKINQLDVDVFQTEHDIVIYAQIVSADMNDVNISIEGDANIVIIEGRRTQPESMAFSKSNQPSVYFTEECVWGDFYRRIILPYSVEIEEAEAKIKNGVLIIILPLLKANEGEDVSLEQP